MERVVMSQAKRERNSAVQLLLQWIEDEDLDDELNAWLETVNTPRHLSPDYLAFAAEHDAPARIIEALTPRWQREPQLR